MNDDICYKMFQEYVDWMGFDKLNTSFDQKRIDNRYNKPMKYTGRETLKKGVEFRSILVESLDYLMDTTRNNKSEITNLLHLCKFIIWPSNKVEINKVNPTQKELADIFGVSERRCREILFELEYMEIIKSVRGGRNNSIFINPFIIRAGPEIDIATSEMFRETTFADIMAYHPDDDNKKKKRNVKT